MGADYFDNYVAGDDLKEAFSKAVQQAQWESGHGGYSGTIAEKSEVQLRSATPMSLKEALAFAAKDSDENDHDKWGPAWAVKVKDDDHNGFLFYGYASS